MSDQYILAIDLGTSGPKVALVATNGSVVAGAFAPTTLYLPPEGGAEQDPVEWWAAICTATRRLFDARPDAVARVGGVCVTAQWSGTVAVDAEGMPLTRALTWLDDRGSTYIRRVTGGFPAIQGYGATKLWAWIRKTGGIPGHSGKDPVAHILYLQQAHPEVYRKTYKFLEPKDYLNFKLTGRFAATYDSITLHWVTDNRTIAEVHYDDELLRLTGLDRAKLPDLCAATDVLGPLTPQAAADLGLDPRLQVVAGTPDIHSAAVGSGAVDDYAAHYCIGTSAWLGCHVPYKKTDITHNMASLPSALPGRYLLINEHETAGACLPFIRDHLLFAGDPLADNPAPADFYARLDTLVEQTPAGSGGVLFTPWLNGERSPVDDHTVRAGWHNLSMRTTRGHLLRAVYEGVALNGRWLLEYVEKFVGRRLDTIRIVGGGARSNIWCQIHADILQRRIEQVADPVHTNTRGAGYLGAIGLGYMRPDQLHSLAPIAAVYEPDGGFTAQSDRLYSEFVQLYQRNRKIYARLNGRAHERVA